jgi:hypothetical protein
MAYQCLEKSKETGLVVFMAHKEDQAVTVGMLMLLDDTKYPAIGDSMEMAGAQVNLTRAEAVMEEHARYEEAERYQRVARAVAARRAADAEAKRLKDCDFGYGCSPGLCGCSCKTQVAHERLARMFTVTFLLQPVAKVPDPLNEQGHLDAFFIDAVLENTRRIVLNNYDSRKQMKNEKTWKTMMMMMI